VTILDNGVNSTNESIERVKSLAGEEARQRVTCHDVDLCDSVSLDSTLAPLPDVDACIHFAALKAVGESTREPLRYYQNNISGTINLLSALDKKGCRNIIFSSSATVYGSADMPVTEETPVGVGITNPYGKTKYMIEEILRDLSSSPSGSEWGICILRYFNPVGSHPSGRIGEDPNGPPNNLMPYVAQVAVGRRESLTVFGNDYPTPDGTGVRDYVHVMDLAEGHLAAMKHLQEQQAGYFVFNLGTGHGFSVLEMIAAMEKASGRTIKHTIGERRPGDIATCFAATDKAREELGWQARFSIDEMCEDLWRWQSNNPQGYAAASS